MIHIEISVNSLLLSIAIIALTIGLGYNTPFIYTNESEAIVDCVDEPAPMRVTYGNIGSVQNASIIPLNIDRVIPEPDTIKAVKKVLPQRKKKSPSVSEAKYSDYQGIIWFLKSYEKFSPVSFWDHKQATYGWGNKAPKVGIKISRSEADLIFVEDINKRYNKLLTKYPNLSKDRCVALVLTNLMFNIGEGKKGTRVGLSKAIKNYDPTKLSTKKELCRMIKKYNRASGKVLGGLVKRRNAEVELIMATPLERQKLFEKYRKIVVNIK